MFGCFWSHEGVRGVICSNSLVPAVISPARIPAVLYPARGRGPPTVPKVERSLWAVLLTNQTGDAPLRRR